MHQAKDQIITTDRGLERYYLSIVEKQNDMGLLFNTRILFLLSGHHLGYLSKVDLNKKPQDLKFEGPKLTTLLVDIKNIKKNKDQLDITFTFVRDQTITQRTWFIKYSSEILCQRWYDLILKEQVQALKLQEEAERPPKEHIRIQEGINTQQQENRGLTMVSRNMELVEQIRRERQMRQTRDMATSVSPKNSKLAQSSKKNTSGQELARMMSEGQNNQLGHSNKSKDSDTLKGDQTIISSKKANVQNSIKSEPNNFKGHDFSYRILAASNPNDISHSKHSQSKHSSPSDKKQSSEDYVGQMSNKKYLNRNSSQYLDRINDLIKKSHLIKDQSMNKLSTPDELDELRQTQKSPRFQISHFNKFPPRRQIPKHDKPWTFKYVKMNHLMFEQFKTYTEQLMIELISDIGKILENRSYKMKLFKNNIAYYDIQDVEVKLAVIELETVERDNGKVVSDRISNKAAVKALQNQFNDYKALYEYLGDNIQLRVPLVSLCEFQGFVALFKILSQSRGRPIKNKNVKMEIEALKERSKIECNFDENINRVIIELDSLYYDQLKTSADQRANFNLYFIQEMDHYMLPDLMSSKEPSSNWQFRFRKEVIQQYSTNLLAIKNDFDSKQATNNPFQYRQHLQQLQKISQVLSRKIKSAAEEIDSLSVYFMNSSEISKYLHSKGINIRYIGHIYDLLLTTYAKRILMSEIAARSIKTLFRKTIQDILMQQSYLSGEFSFHSKVCDFLNCVLGMSHETAQMWRVVSAHAYAYYGKEINFSQIDRWYFVISLIENCKLKVHWNRIDAQHAFKSNNFFSDQNLEGVAFEHKIYPPIYSEYYHLTLQILEKQESRQNFQKLKTYLSLDSKPLPAHLALLHPQITKYLCHFISPVKANQIQFRHLSLYFSSGLLPSKAAFQILLIEIKWYLKLNMKEDYIRCCNNFINYATKYYGQFHPIFSQLYDLFSAYHLANNEYQDAVTFGKSSLVNMLKICNSHHEKTAQCYYHLALCYLKASKIEEAITHLNKAKQYFQNYGKNQKVAYGAVCLKMGLLMLSQSQLQEAIDCTNHALAILERQKDSHEQFEDQITQCFEVLARCYELLQDRDAIQKLAKDCLDKIKNIKQPNNLEKMLKIYLYPILSSLPSQTASTLINLLASLTFDITEDMHQISSKRLAYRIQDDSLSSSLKTYLDRILSIDAHIKQRGLLQDWIFFGETYPRETVKDFIDFLTELIALLGDNFLVGSLRESL